MAATEEEVGIECYISDEVPGFSAILRHRWSDFKVYEVDLQGKVRAADLKVRGDGSSWKWRPSSASGGAGGVPVSKQAAVLSSVQLPKSLDGSADVERASVLRDESIAAVCADFSQVAGQEAAVQLREFLQAWQQCRGEGSNSEGTEAGERLGGGEGQRAVALPRQLTIGPFPDKEKRRAVHGFFRREPRIPQLESAAAAGGEDGHGQQQAWSISLEPAGAAAGAGSDTKRARRDGRGRGRGRRRGAEWRGGGLAYVRMVLWKRNMDTQAALSLLARQLGVQSKGLGIAGTKDKRGITCQFVTAWKIDPQRLQQVGRGLGGLELGNFEFFAQPLQLGQLRGNAFSLTLRNVTPAGPERLKQVAAACASAQRHGFINYFGLQRFGSGSVATHLVGAALLRGAWKEAADLIMTGRADERREVAEARTKYFAGDIKGALDGMPKKCVAESAVLSALSKRGGKDYVGALCSIPRHLRSMFLHAFQSFLWNKAVSHRIRTAGGRAVVQGDLVIPAASADVGPSDGGAAEAEADDGGRGDAPGSAAVARLEAVHVVSAEEAACGRFSMEEVVLPLPGHLTLLPHHSTAEVYRSLAAQLGVDLAIAPHSVREFSVAHQRGDYRHLIHRPADLTFRLIRHASLDDELESAADGPLKPDGSCNDDTGWLQSISLAQPACAPVPGPGRKRKAPDNAPDAPPDADSAAKPWPDRLGCEVPVEGSGEYVSLQLRFGLPASGYATMLVREVMKTSTSTSFHRRLTAAELNQAPALDNPVADATDGPPS